MAATASSTRYNWLSALFVVYSVFVTPSSSSSDDTDYARSLLKFKQSLTNATMLNDWKEPVVDKLCSNNIPNWSGCLCMNNSFVELKLEGMGLGGTIDIDSLSNLPLFVFSVANNNFLGPFPSDVNKLGRLRIFNLANNYGEIRDDAFSGMKWLRRVMTRGNFFTGNIPFSLTELPRLVDLQLQMNHFEGRIPDFSVNFSYNDLEGLIPVSLST